MGLLVVVVLSVEFSASKMNIFKKRSVSEFVIESFVEFADVDDVPFDVEFSISKINTVNIRLLVPLIVVFVVFIKAFNSRSMGDSIVSKILKLAGDKFVESLVILVAFSKASETPILVEFLGVKVAGVDTSFLGELTY